MAEFPTVTASPFLLLAVCMSPSGNGTFGSFLHAASSIARTNYLPQTTLLHWTLLALPLAVLPPPSMTVIAGGPTLEPGD